MSADLHIHILENCTEDDIRLLSSNTLGSKYFGFDCYSTTEYDKAYDAVQNSPDIWIGSVSWLKASVFEDSNSYIPNTVLKIYELIGEDLPELTDELIAKIVECFNLKNTTTYSLADIEDVKEFLNTHKGKKVFTISW
jgi:hypothetical protein